jgi:predicted nucleic acid-binding protein
MLFVDTGAWLALYDRSDQFHPKAFALANQLKTDRIPWGTTDYVFSESVTLIRFRLGHEAAVAFGRSVLDSQVVTLFDVTQEDRQEAWSLFVKYQDQDFSFTDCTSFAVMKRLKIREAFGFDRHFLTAGFLLLQD